MALVVFVYMLLVQNACAAEMYRSDGLIDKLSNGMKFAKDFLASESVASTVAEFIVKAFQPKPPSPTANRRHPVHSEDGHDKYTSSEESYNENRPNYPVKDAQNPMSTLRYFVRLLGLQPNQISAVAVNALVFVAQMITTFLAGPRRPPTRTYRFDDATNWILNKNSRKLQEIIATAKNDSLSDMLESLIKEKSENEDTSCIQLLVCKVTPFVNKMQNAVFGKQKETDDKLGKLRGAAIMYRHLPSSTEINNRSDYCEKKHEDCNLIE